MPTERVLDPSVWDAYEDAAQRYLSRDIFQGTPLTGRMFRDAAQAYYNATGVFVPVELALAQGQFESHMGTKGRSPATNPFNVGEFDDRTTQTFTGPQEGVNAYYDLLTRRYLRGRSVDQLLTNFVNDEGNRYASNPNYERDLRNQMQVISGYLGR